MATFAIDYDGTYTLCPELFRKIVEAIQGHGHRVVIVTSRPPGSVLAQQTQEFVFPLPVVCAGAVPKRRAAVDQGYEVDIWIDDMPETIGWALLVGEDK